MFEVVTDAAASLLELARDAAPEFLVAAAVVYSLRCMLQAGHPGLSLHSSCSGKGVWFMGAE